MQDFSIHRAQAFSWTEEESKIVNKHTSKNLIIMHATFLEKQKFKNHNLSFKAPMPISFLFQYNGWIILKTVWISIYLFTSDCIYGKVKAYRPARNLKPNKTKSMLNTKRWESERGWQCAELENRKRMLHGKGTQNWFLGRGRFWVKLHWNPRYSQSQVGNSYLLDSNPFVSCKDYETLLPLWSFKCFLCHRETFWLGIILFISFHFCCLCFSVLKRNFS